MRLLGTLACLTQICSAFYPYHLPTPESDRTSKNTPRAIELPRSLRSESSKRSAFYPFHLPEPEKKEEETTTPSPHALQHPRRTDNASFRVRLRRVLTRRKNNFNVIPAVNPQQSNSLGIYQDGTDLSYFCAFRIGTSQEDYYFLLDSAASNTWVMSSDCTTNACSVHNTFGPSDSSSLKVSFL